MLALLRFHLVVGVRVAVRAFVPLFAGLLAVIMLQMYPAAFVTSLALILFSRGDNWGALAATAVVTFLLPAWGAPRLSLGVNGWVRHIAPSDLWNRRGLELALLVVQLPLVVSLLILAVIARLHGASIWQPVTLRIIVLLAAGALAAVPVARSWAVRPACAIAAALATFGTRNAALLAVVLLVLAECSTGPLLTFRSRHRRDLRLPFAFGIAWRAIGWRLAPAYCAGLLPLLGAQLFVANNDLQGTLAAGAWRFGLGFGVGLLLSSVSEILAIRRPVWPWLRSLPSSSTQRVITDAGFLAAHAAPLLALGASFHLEAALAAACLVPFFALRAAWFMRRVQERKWVHLALVAEFGLVSGLSALLSWAAVAWLMAAVPAFESARRAEAGQKVTRWLETHHASAGDSLSWSE